MLTIVNEVDSLIFHCVHSSFQQLDGQANAMVGCEGESEGKREKTQKKSEVKQKEKGAKVDISIKLLVTTCILSQLATFSDELGFVANNDTDVYDFIFSDDIFSSLFATFSDEIGFVTNSVLSNAFSDESFCRKKLKLLATK